MKMIFLCSSLAAGKGGAERICIELANDMVSRGHDVTLMYKTGKPSYYVVPSVKHITWKTSKELFRDCKKSFLNFNPEIAFCFYYSHEVYELFSFFFNTGVPFGVQECVNPERIMSVHWVPKTGCIGKAIFERNLIASASSVIRLESESFKSSFSPIVQNSIHVSPNAVLPAKNLANPAGKNGEKKYIINIGGTKKHKNATVLLKAFSLVAPKNQDWVIRIYGIDNPNLEFNKSLKKLIKDLRISSQVEFMGQVDDMYSGYSAGHIHVTTSLSESFGMCVAESMVHGLPTVAFKECPGVNDLVKDNFSGLLVEGRDKVSALADALNLLMHDDNLRARLGINALENSKMFDAKKIFNHWEAILKEAASYKKDKDRLLKEQMTIDPERALHYNRMRHQLFSS